MQSSEEPAEAWLAVREFNRLIPTLEAYVRALTGKRYTVKPSAKGSFTDKKSVNIQPPMELGRLVPHARMICDVRDPETGRQHCDACRSREETLVQVYHEISHIAYGTMQVLQERQILKINDKLQDTGFKQKVRGHSQLSALAAGAQINPHGALLANAMEDVRINARMFEARPGTRAMMEALTNAIFEGTWNPAREGESSNWSDAPRDAQAIVAFSLIAEGYDHLVSHLSEEVVSLAEDEILLDLANGCSESNSSFETLLLLPEVVKRMNELGFLIPPESEESDDSSDEDEEDEGGDGGSESDSSESDDSSPSGGSGSPDGGESSPDPSAAPGDGSDDDASRPPEADSSASGDESGDTDDDGNADASSGQQSKPEASDPTESAKAVERFLGHGLEGDRESSPRRGGVSDLEEDENNSNDEIEVAINQAENFESFSANVSGVRYERSPGGGTTKSPDRADITRAVARGRIIFEKNKRSHHVPHLKSGKINTRVLGKRAPLGDERLFRKKIVPDDIDYAVIIGVDVSGSTRGANLALEKTAVLAQAEVLDRLNIPFAIYAHTGMAEYGDFWSDVDLYLEVEEVKSLREKWSKVSEKRLAGLRAKSANIDGHALEFLNRRALESRAKQKIVMYYSDGEMPAENYEEELQILKREIERARRSNIALMGVGIRTSSPTRHGLDTVRVDSSADMVNVIRHIEKSLDLL